MVNNNTKKRILICGHRCFAAKGLIELLQIEGHDVICFSRGDVRQDGKIITGSVFEINENPYLKENFDIVINYIILHGKSVEENIEYIKKLLIFCSNNSVSHIIHISSCSAYRNDAKKINESAPIEENLLRKGPYAAIKSAQEIYITANAPCGLKVSQLRPGLIIANGMGGYIGGIGIRLPWNTIIGLGNSKSRLPLVTRDAVNRTVVNLVNNPPEMHIEHLLLADSSSPTRKVYLEACCEALGVGTKVRFFPVWLWLSTAYIADFLSKLVGQGKIGIKSKVSSVCRYQEFNSRMTERRVGVNFSRNWKMEMLNAFDFQSKNYSVFPIEYLSKTNAKKVTYIGFGRIVRQRHIPCLQRIGFDQTIEAFDLIPRKDNCGVEVKDISKAELDVSDLFVVSTPGPVHFQAMRLLINSKGPILIEKPLAYSEKELSEWIEFASIRKYPVFACHDRRYKGNVIKMLSFLSKYNSGELHSVSCVFQSPAVNKESVPWLKAERKARTLLMDYGIHPIDLACMFGRGEPRLLNCRHLLNGQGETSLIEASAEFENYPVHILLRQGINQRKTKIIYTFQNYSVILGFSPDIFVPCMSDDNFGLSMLETKESLIATFFKVRDRLLNSVSETSHAYALQAAINANENHPLEIRRLAPIYNLLFQISKEVYGE